MHGQKRGELVVGAIIDYIKFLKSDFNFNITIHEKSGRLLRLDPALVEYNIHQTPYCLCVKSVHELWDMCVKKQWKVYEKAKKCDIFYGSCYAGMEEFVLPIKNGDEVCGFVSVCGYCKDFNQSKKKIMSFADKYRLSPDILLNAYQNSTSSDIPNEKTVKTLITPLCAMLELLYVKSEKYFSDVDMGYEASYIYAHVVAYLKKAYQTKVTLKDLSALCHCSNSYISHLFKKSCGMSISRYTNLLRLTEAKKLLKNTHISIKQISERTGFSDSNYFSNSFKKEFGISASEYRKQKETKEEQQS